MEERNKIFNIYLAAPIVNITEKQKEQINKIKDILNIFYEHNLINLYDPKKHGVPNAWGMPMNEWCRCIFTLDVVAIDNSDWVIVCDYGRQGTAGTAWECGYAFGKGKKVLIIQMNEWDDTPEYSVMMQGCSSNYCTFKDFIKDVSEKHFFGKLLVERGRLPQEQNLN